MGVRQGDPLSPTLFGLYIELLVDDLAAGMSPGDTFAVGGVPVYSLLYADDLVLVAATPQALQRELDLLGGFCTTWGLDVNMAKTNTVVFNPSKQDRLRTWSFGGASVKPASQYKYLGLIFDETKGLQGAAQGRLVDSGRMALFSMMGVCSDKEITDPSIRAHMFQALVLPVLSYGAELWGGYSPPFLSAKYFDKTPAEKVHVQFLRWLTGASKGTSKRILVQAAGRQPLGAHWTTQLSAFWNKLAAMGEDRLARLAFKDNILLMHQGGKCWASRALEHLGELRGRWCR